MDKYSETDDDYEDVIEVKIPKPPKKLPKKYKESKTLPSQDKSTDEKSTSEDEMDKKTERRLEKKIQKLQKKIQKEELGPGSSSRESKGDLGRLLSEDKKFHMEQLRIREGHARIRRKYLVKIKAPPELSASGWDKKSGEQDVGLSKYFENYTKFATGNIDFIKKSVSQDAKEMNMLEFLFEKEPEMKPEEYTDLSIEDLYHREVRTHMINLLNECKRIEAERQSMRTNHTLSSLSLASTSIRSLARTIFNGTPTVQKIAFPSFELLNWILERHLKEITFPRNFIIIILSRLAEMFWQFGDLADLKEQFIYSGLIDSVYVIMKGYTIRKLEACWACYSMCMATVGCGKIIEEIRNLEGVEKELEIFSQDFYWAIWEYNFAQFLQSILYGPNYPALKGIKLFKFTIRGPETSDKLHLVGDKFKTDKPKHEHPKLRKMRDLLTCRKNKVQDQPKTLSQQNQEKNYDDAEIRKSQHVNSSGSDSSEIGSGTSEDSTDSAVEEYLQYLEDTYYAEKNTQDPSDSN